MGSMFEKYHHERQDGGGQPLHWPGGPAGFPFKGTNPPLLPRKEFDDLPLNVQFNCQIFYLDKPEDLKVYKEICDKVANGLFFLKDRDRQWNDAAKNYRVYLEWVEPYYAAKADTTFPQ